MRNMELDAELAIIAEQERQLVFDKFDEDSAWSLGLLLRGWASANASPVVIDIQAFGRPVFFAAMAGSSPDNVDWVRRKRNVVMRFHRSSYAVGLELKLKGNSLEDPYGLAETDYVGHGGAFPLRIRDCGVVGCVTVSGLPQREDHRAVVRALCSLLGSDQALAAFD
jgi:uncharacterized protein (UPF0303 family)